MNGRNYVPFKTKKSASVVSTTDSLISELSCSTQVIGQVDNQLNKKKFSSSTQIRLNNKGDHYRSHGKLNGSTTHTNNQMQNGNSSTQTFNKQTIKHSASTNRLLKKKPFCTSMSSVNSNLNRNWCSMTSLASHQSERTNCTYLLRTSSQLPNTHLNKIDLINAIPQTTNTRFYLNYSSPIRSVLTSDNELIDCPIHLSHRCNPFTCYHNQLYNSQSNENNIDKEEFSNKSISKSISNSTLTFNNLSTTSDLNSTTSNIDNSSSNLDDVGISFFFVGISIV